MWIPFLRFSFQFLLVRMFELRVSLSFFFLPISSFRCFVDLVREPFQRTKHTLEFTHSRLTHPRTPETSNEINESSKCVWTMVRSSFFVGFPQRRLSLAQLNFDTHTQHFRCAAFVALFSAQIISNNCTSK